MALSINHPSPFGGAAFTYFIVGEVRENRYYGNATVVVYGFLSADARQAMSNFVPISITIDAANWIKDATIGQIYTMIKATREFSSATDV